MKTSKFQFLNPYLVELNYSENPRFDKNANKELEMQNSFNVQIQRDKDKNQANVQLTLNVNDDYENTPFKLSVKVASDFVWEDMDDKRVETMLNLNAPALLLGYMRPIVSSVTNVSAFPVYNIPFVNFKE